MKTNKKPSAEDEFWHDLTSPNEERKNLRAGQVALCFSGFWIIVGALSFVSGARGKELEMAAVFALGSLAFSLLPFAVHFGGAWSRERKRSKRK